MTTNTYYRRLAEHQAEDIAHRHNLYAEAHRNYWDDDSNLVCMGDVLNQADNPDDDGSCPTLKYPDPETVRTQAALAGDDLDRQDLLEAWIDATLDLLHAVADLDDGAVPAHLSKSATIWAAFTPNKPNSS